MDERDLATSGGFHGRAERTHRLIRIGGRRHTMLDGNRRR